MQSVIVPIFICCVLPIAIVLIESLQRRHRENKRSEILLKAIETNKDINLERIAEAMADRRPRRTPEEIRMRRLLLGCILSLVGLAFVIIALLSWLIGNMPFGADEVVDPMLLAALILPVGISYLIVYFASGKKSGK